MIEVEGYITMKKSLTAKIIKDLLLEKQKDI